MWRNNRFGAALNTAKVEPGSTVAVVGCGGIGLSAVQGARDRWLRAYYCSRYRLFQNCNWPENWVATDLVNANDGDPVEQIMDLTAEKAWPTLLKPWD